MKKNIVENMKNLEISWESFLHNRYKDELQLLRWGQSHRVYKLNDRVLKIEKIDDEKNPTNLGLKYENKILNRLKKTFLNLNPKFFRIDNTWDVLELDFVIGDLLELDYKKQNLTLTTYFNIVYGLFVLSVRGIKYKQFRGRHIIKNKSNSIKFIDFGQSEITSVLIAFCYNFKLFDIVNKKIKPGKLLYFFYFNFFKKNKNTDILKNAEDRFLKNNKRLGYAIADYLKINPGDFIASKQLGLMENNLQKALKLDQYIYLDILDIKFDTYGLSGYKDWGFIWHHILKTTSFTNKIVFEIFCCQAALSSFSILYGAKKGYVFDSNKWLIKASENLANSLRVKKINFIVEGDLDRLNRYVKKYCPDILFACSYRLNNISNEKLMRLFKKVNEVFWETNIKNINSQELEKIGFYEINHIVKTGFNRVLVYLSKR